MRLGRRGKCLSVENRSGGKDETVGSKMEVRWKGEEERRCGVVWCGEMGRKEEVRYDV